MPYPFVRSGRLLASAERAPADQRPGEGLDSDEFLAEVRGMPQRNLAVVLVHKLLTGEIRARRRTRRDALPCGASAASARGGAVTRRPVSGRGSPGRG